MEYLNQQQAELCGADEESDDAEHNFEEDLEAEAD